MQLGYGHMTGCLRLPLGGVSESFRQGIPTPLIAGRSERDPGDTLIAIGVSPTDPRPRVLVALRGGVPETVLRAAAIDAGDYLLLVPGGKSILDGPPNLHIIPAHARVRFADLVAAGDVVLSKLGYGIVSDCIASEKRLLWPRRTGFREDDVVERDGPAYLRMRELSRADFEAGRWRTELDKIMAAAPPAGMLPTDGAARVADHLIRTS
jgi:L-arabinokinase